MFKKIDNYLISNYPLLWNTRIVQVLLSTVVIHILFYLAGLLAPIPVTELWNYSHFKTQDTVMFSGLLTAVIIILWQLFFLRNNPFKSFYTLGRNYLFAEFALIFLVFFSTATFFLTYQQGLYDNVKNKTSDTDLYHEADLINLAYHFTAFNIKDFDVRTCCDSLESYRIRDSIRSINNPNYYPPPAIVEQYDENTNEWRDSGENYERSYLHYCKRAFNYSDENEDEPHLKTAQELSATANRWLMQNKKDSVRWALQNLKNLCNKYGVTCNFNMDEQVNECFNDERHTVQKVLRDGNENYNYTSERNYIATDELSSALSRIHTLRDGFWTTQVWQILLYYCLAASIFLFSFRLTRLRQWFSALVGIGLWSILISLIVVSTRIDDDFPVLLLFIWGVLLALCIFFTYGREAKRFAGIAFNWVLWFMPLVIPLVFVVILENTEVGCNYITFPDSCPPPPPIHFWIKDNWPTINTINIVSIIAAIYLLFIPLALKWQSNPEE